MLTKTFWKCHNNWLNVGVRVRYRNTRALVAVGGKIVAATKKGTSKCEGVVNLLLLLLERRRSSWVCSTWSDSQWTVLLGGHDTFEKGSAKEEAWGVETQDLDAAPRQRTCSHVAPYPWIFGAARDDSRPPTALLSRFGPCWLFFLFPKLKFTLEGRRFQTIEEISLRDLCAIPQNAFQNWKKSWERHIKSGVEYFGEDKSY
jgi:hypothetical protein